MKRIYSAGFIIVMLTAFISSCSTKVDLNADWKNTTIIYSLLDKNDDYHYVMINKAFLGEGNAYDMALIQDSSEYDNATAVIEELANGNVIATYTLRDTLLSNRPSDGIFYYPEQKVYYFVKSNLNEDNQYRLRVTVDESPDEITSTTELVKDFSLDNVNSVNIFSFSNGNLTSPTYNVKKVKWIPSNAVRYEVILRIKWDEISTSGTVRKYLDWHQGTYFSEFANAGLLEVAMDGQSFFTFLRDNIPFDANVTARKFRAVDFIIYGAAQDVDTYIKVNEPSSGLVQERPEFTNVSNGIGLFSSRNHMVFANRKINQFTMEQLAGGQLTSSLLFCTDSSVYSTQTYYCP